MKRALFVTAMLAGVAIPARAADQAVSLGLFGGYLLADSLEAIGDTPIVAPRIGYWPRSSLGFELDIGLMPAGRTQVGVPERFPYFGLLPVANLVGRVFDDQPLQLLLNVGIGPFVKKISDDGALGLPTGDNLDVDFAGVAGPGLMVPLGNIALRTEYRWVLNVGTENWDNRGDVFLDGAWTLGVMYLPMGPRDTDKDGLADDVDGCIDQAEDFDEFKDDDGCPDLDNDEDGLADTADQCPLEAEDFDEFEDDNGCPDADNDGDEVLDGDDECPIEAGSPDTAGCPDTDGDKLADSADECPEEAGEAAAFGCPDRDADRVPDYRDECPDEAAPEGIDAMRSDGCVKKFYIAEDKIVITEKVQFDSGRAVVKKGSFEMLDGIAKMLEKQKGIKVLQVEGHTDSDGDDAKNLKLSQDRADAVKAYLVGKGVAEDRLLAKGFGEASPLVDNDTKENKETNRRVEFNISKQDVGKRMRQKVKEGEVERLDDDDSAGEEGAGGEEGAEASGATGAKPAEPAPAKTDGGATGAKPAEPKPAAEPKPEGAATGAKPAEPKPAAEPKPEGAPTGAKAPKPEPEVPKPASEAPKPAPTPAPE
jgi:outer membrane protein OmpA-like peptidoglycan-associated protein